MIGGIISKVLGYKTGDYAVPVTNDQKDGESEVYRNVDFVNELSSTPQEGILNLQDLIMTVKDNFSDKKCFGTLDNNREYQWNTYDQAVQIAIDLGSAVVYKKLAPKYNEHQNFNLGFLAIYSKNREEYMYVEMACALYGFVSVPIYDTLGPDAMNYILAQTKVTTIFVSDKTLSQVMKDIGKLASIQNVISFDAITQEQIDKFETFNIKLSQYKDLIKEGQQNPQEMPKIDKQEIYTISYTSGTTGNPKGAMLSHQNITSVIAATTNCDINPNKNDVHLSYLPLAHVFEKVVIYTMFYAGAQIGFSCGDTLKLKDDINQLKPTVFPSVPRIYNKFYDIVQGQLKSQAGLKGKVAAYAVKSKLYYLQQGAYYSHTAWDNMIFNKVKNNFGGKVNLFLIKIRVMVTAAAPISLDVLEFMKIACCCPILEGYGQTESTGASFVTRANDPQSGHVGGPTANTEFKVVDVAEMGYTSKDKNEQGEVTPRGEIWIRGPGVFAGYYKDLEKTNEAKDSEGWLKTGDIGVINTNGSLKIIDRKKNIFKLAQGEYVAAEKIELICQSSASCEDTFIYGDSLQSTLVAIVQPRKGYVAKKAKELGLQEDYQNLIKTKQFCDIVQKDINDHGKAHKLLGFEIPKKVFLIGESFQALGLTTATAKLQRHLIKKHFQTEIDQMYKDQQQ